MHPEAPSIPATPAPRLPFPAWPVWLVLGLFLIPALVGLGLVGSAKDDAAERLGFQRDALGRSAVLDGLLAEVTINPGLPIAQSHYTVEIPEDVEGPAAGTTITVGGDEHWGFPPSEEFPERLSFLVLFDDPPRSIEFGEPGTVAEVNAGSVADAERAVSTSTVVWIVSIVVFWACVLGLPSLGIVLGLRRRRARRAMAPPVGQSAQIPR